MNLQEADQDAAALAEFRFELVALGEPGSPRPTAVALRINNVLHKFEESRSATQTNQAIAELHGSGWRWTHGNMQWMTGNTMTNDDQRRLQEIQARLAAIYAEQQRLEGQRDELLRMQCDNAGAHDQRPVAVR